MLRLGGAETPAVLVVLAGLPGTGETTLARELSSRLGAVHLRIDSIEAALALRIHPAEDAGYVVACAVAGDNLRLGCTVVADSVNPIEVTRSAWRAVAAGPVPTGTGRAIRRIDRHSAFSSI